ncbi:MAG: hypothetical protein ABSD68_01875 [Candidatus Micrarchaeales archaeon]|jgi:hypothetical protein
MRGHIAFAFLIILLATIPQVNAYFNATYLTTTVFLTNSTTARVVESIQLYIGNSSVSAYNQDRQAFNLSLNDWQKAIGSPFLVEHILNPKGSISNFTFLPGPLALVGNGGGYASLTISYEAYNVTSIIALAPRKFEYTFNSTVFNFLHTASGQSLPTNAKLTITVPIGAQIAAIYPVPDSPQQNSVGQYNSTSFSWFSGEPLKKFTFTYIVTETPQQEVVQYFNYIYSTYTSLIYMLILLAIVAIGLYIYVKIFR